MSARVAVVAAAFVVLAACGESGSGGAGERHGFVLAEVRYGRLLTEAGGARLVSPLTTVERDPLTGEPIAGSLTPLAPEVDPDVPQSFGLGRDYLPRVIPRDGALELDFTAPVDAASITADLLDAGGALLRAGSIQLRRGDGAPVAVALEQVGPRTVRLLPMDGAPPAFPPSPVDFGPSGEPRVDATGYLRLLLPRSGDAVVRAVGGPGLEARADRLGDPDAPIGLNPGNRVLDFVQHNALIPTQETFHGFLPDRTSPRVIRRHRHEHRFAPEDGDTSVAGELGLAGAAFSPQARGGRGEWADATLVLRDGAVDEERRSITGNGLDTVQLDGAFAVPPAAGDLLALERIEWFEPDLADPLDPARFDPDNPELLANTSFANFVEAFEIDAGLNVVRGPIALRDAVPTFAELRVRFSEPLAADSLLAWETFRVRRSAGDDPAEELLVEAALDPTGAVAILRPVRRDAAAGTAELVGFGAGTRNLELVATTIPRAGVLCAALGSVAHDAFIDEGFRGITDVTGQPLAYPPSWLDPAEPPIAWSAPFTTHEAAITQPAPPPVRDWGVVVHRLRGRPLTGVDPASGRAGVQWRDQPGWYAPIVDVNLLTNGVLAGAPVVDSTRIHDQFFPPEGQFDVVSSGLPAPLSSSSQVGSRPHDGARFQAVWRDVDCSPNRDALAGTLLDLWRVSWCPVGGAVTTDSYDDLSIHCAHSPLRPISAANGATYPNSGLGRTLSYATFIDLLDGGSSPCPGLSCASIDGPNHWDELRTVVLPGTRHVVSAASLYSLPGDGNAWHAWPEFAVPFQYNNGGLPQEEIDLRNEVNRTHDCAGLEWEDYRTANFNNLGGDSLLFEVRIRPQSTLVSGANGFAHVVGSLLGGLLPGWRAYSCGGNGVTLNPDDLNGDVNARCAVGHLDSSSPRGVDNSRYLAVFDYRKTTSRITAPFVRGAATTAAPDWFPALLDPPLASQPLGTAVQIEYAGARTANGAGASAFTTSVDVADGFPCIAFRATLVGDVASRRMPLFDTIALPFLRPDVR